MSRVRGWKDRHGVGHVLITGSALVLSLTAVTGIVAFDDPRILRLAVVAALWALICAVTATRLRPEPLAASQELRLQRVYQAELEREIVARREYELWLEVRLRRELEETVRRDVEALRVDVESLHRVVVDDWANDGSPVASWAQVMPDPEYWGDNPALPRSGPAGELPGLAAVAALDQGAGTGFSLDGADTPSGAEVPVNGSAVPVPSSPTATGGADDPGEQTGVGWPGGDRGTDPGLGWPSTLPRWEPADAGCGPTTTGRLAGVAGRYDQGAEVADREREAVPGEAGEAGGTVGSNRRSIEDLLSGSEPVAAGPESVEGPVGPGYEGAAGTEPAGVAGAVPGDEVVPGSAGSAGAVPETGPADRGDAGTSAVPGNGNGEVGPGNAGVPGTVDAQTGPGNGAAPRTVDTATDAAETGRPDHGAETGPGNAVVPGSVDARTGPGNGAVPGNVDTAAEAGRPDRGAAEPANVDGATGTDLPHPNGTGTAPANAAEPAGPPGGSEAVRATGTPGPGPAGGTDPEVDAAPIAAAASNGVGTHHRDDPAETPQADVPPVGSNGTGTDPEDTGGRHHREDDDNAAPWLVVDPETTAARPRRRHYREDGEENEVLARVLGR